MSRWLGIVVTCALAACTTDPECDGAGDCDDGDVCTEDRCRLGLCSHLAITHCCHEARPCPNPDLPACDMDAAPDAGRCVACLEDDDCRDPTLPVCSPQPFPHCAGCLVHTDCPPGQICNAGECLPPPPGGPCTRDADCASNWCLRESDTGFPGGFCGEACNGPEDCPATGACVDAAGQGMTCLGPCLPPPSCPPEEYCPPDCRPEYMCVPTGPATTACAPHCVRPGHCPEVGACDPWSGLCTPTPTGAVNGAPCTTDADCRGFCVTEAESGAPGGVCASACSDPRRACPADDLCMYFLGPWAETRTLCQPEFDWGTGCRPAYAPQIAGMLPTDNPEWAAAPVCLPACQDADCASGICNEYSGVCNNEPDPSAGDYGDPCASNADCKGMCLFLWPAGYCMGPCILGGPACPDSAVCMNLGLLTSCGPFCDDNADCREPDYVCNPTLQACVPP